MVLPVIGKLKPLTRWPVLAARALAAGSDPAAGVAGQGGQQPNDFGCGAPAGVEHMDEKDGARVRAACKLGLEGIVSKRRNSPYRSGRSLDWINIKNPAAPAVRREAEEDWGR